VQLEPPLGYDATLDALAALEGTDVLVIAHSQAPGEPQSHTQVVLRGKLGPVKMVDNLIDGNTMSVAAYKVGSDPMNTFYLSVGDFVHTMKLPGLDRHFNIKFEHDFHIEIQPAP
jgi:hypothetical protein